MASQTRIDSLFRSQGEEGDDGGLSAMRGHMFSGWPVATFAAGILRRLFPAGYAPEVRILIKLEPDVGVTGLANHASHIFLRAGFGLAEGDEKK